MTREVKIYPIIGFSKGCIAIRVRGEKVDLDLPTSISGLQLKATEIHILWSGADRESIDFAWVGGLCVSSKSNHIAPMRRYRESPDGSVRVFLKSGVEFVMTQAEAMQYATPKLGTIVLLRPEMAGRVPSDDWPLEIHIAGLRYRAPGHVLRQVTDRVTEKAPKGPLTYVCNHLETMKLLHPEELFLTDENDLRVYLIEKGRGPLLVDPFETGLALEMVVSEDSDGSEAPAFMREKGFERIVWTRKVRETSGNRPTVVVDGVSTDLEFVDREGSKDG